MNDFSTAPDRVARALWISVRNITTNSDQLDALWGELSEALTAEPLKGLRMEVIDEDLEDDTEWVTAAYRATFSVRQVVTGRRGRRKQLGHLTVVTRLFDANEEQGSGWVGACIPKVFLAFSTGTPWTNSELRLSGEGSSEFAVPHSARRWCWFEDGEPVPEIWFFVVPLADLSADDLRPQIIEPVIKLINGASDEEAFPEGALALPTPSASA